MELLGYLGDLFPSRGTSSHRSRDSRWRSSKRLQLKSSGPTSPSPCGKDFFSCLPDDLIHSITDFLPSPTLAVLRRVCRKFHYIIKPKEHIQLAHLYALQNSFNLTWTGLEYLYCIARDDLNKFVCETCLRIHRIRGYKRHGDAVTDPFCKAGWRKSFLLSTRMGHAALMKNFYMVQLCLKWKRFENEGKISDEYRFLCDHLMKPRKTAYTHVATNLVSGTWFSYGIKYNEPIELATETRIHQGRFLLRTTWKYPPVHDANAAAWKSDNPDDQPHFDKMKLLSTNIGDIQICPHQAHLLFAREIGPQISGTGPLSIICSSRLRRYLPNSIAQAFGVGIWTSDEVSSRGIKRGYANIFQLYQSLPTLTQKTAFQRSVKRASKNYNGPIYGSCKSCPTDWRVEYAFHEAKGLELSLVVWQDLGGEGSPLNEGWRCQVTNLGVEGTEKAKIVRQSAGSVRELWDSTPVKTHFCD